MNDSNVTIALKLVSDVSSVRDMVHSRRFYDADEVAVQRLRRCLVDMDRRLVLLHRGLLHDPTLRASGRRDEPEGDRANLYRRGATEGATESEGLASLSGEDLLEQARYWYWRYRRETVGF